MFVSNHQKSNNSYFSILPRELLVEIFFSLDYSTLSTCRLVNKEIKNFIDSYTDGYFPLFLKKLESAALAQNNSATLEAIHLIQKKEIQAKKNSKSLTKKIIDKIRKPKESGKIHRKTKLLLISLGHENFTFLLHFFPSLILGKSSTK